MGGGVDHLTNIISLRPRNNFGLLEVWNLLVISFRIDDFLGYLYTSITKIASYLHGAESLGS
jgi:hypothetical protein